jgi:hypothetical protein
MIFLTMHTNILTFPGWEPHLTWEQWAEGMCAADWLAECGVTSYHCSVFPVPISMYMLKF